MAGGFADFNIAAGFEAAEGLSEEAGPVANGGGEVADMDEVEFVVLVCLWALEWIWTWAKNVKYPFAFDIVNLEPEVCRYSIFGELVPR